MTLKKHIDDIRDKLAKREFPNEAAVSQHIVLRLLKALAWPISNTQIVHPEYPVEGGRRVDFALCPLEPIPQVFIEVKRVGKVKWADQQLFEYAFDYGRIPIAVSTDGREFHYGRIPIAVSTDGREWHFFHLRGLKYYGELKVRELNLIEGNTEEIADCFNRYLNYQSICAGEAIRTMKKDYERVYKRKIESKPMPSIPSELRRVIVPPNAEDKEVFFNKTAWKVAYMRWWSEGWQEPQQEKPQQEENGEEMIQVREPSLENIQKSDVYDHCVKYLMQTTYPTAEELDHWRSTGFYKKDMPKKFGHLMRLSPERVEEMIDEVKKEHNSTTREDNKDGKNRDTKTATETCSYRL